MDILSRLINFEAKLAVIGLGYVGFPLAQEFSKKVNVIGFDIDKEKIKGLSSLSNEETDSLLMRLDITCDTNYLNNAEFFIIAVPTPVNQNSEPDLSFLLKACKTVASYIKRGSYIVIESTVYPGVTEDICTPLIEEISGLRNGIDFEIGYSPERINPSDQYNTIRNTDKLVSSRNSTVSEKIASVYKLAIDSDIHVVKSIQVAEAAKLAENIQRDVNIAFMNELAMFLNSMDIETQDVLDAMKTKWNALPFYPGLVGGHCISVDPYYFIHTAKEKGIIPNIVNTSRKVNEEMVDYLHDAILNRLDYNKQDNYNIAILGLTYKENCSDIRNSKSLKLTTKLNYDNINVFPVDPYVDTKRIEKLGLSCYELEGLTDIDALVLAVPHSYFLEHPPSFYASICNSSKSHVIDIRRVLDRSQLEAHNISYWSL